MSKIWPPFSKLSNTKEMKQNHLKITFKPYKKNINTLGWNHEEKQRNKEPKIQAGGKIAVGWREVRKGLDRDTRRASKEMVIFSFLNWLCDGYTDVHFIAIFISSTYQMNIILQLFNN